MPVRLDHVTAVEPGRMVRDLRDAWPADAPVGAFDIERRGVEGYPECTAHIIFVCPNHHFCAVLLGPKPVRSPAPDRLHIWGWDGNMDKPTITPSINCVAEKDGKSTGGCGWHGFITAGVIK